MKLGFKFQHVEFRRDTNIQTTAPSFPNEKSQLPKQTSCSGGASSCHSLPCRVLIFLIGKSEHTCVLHCQVPPIEWLGLLLYWGLAQRSGLLRSQLAVSEVTPCFHALRRLCISCHTCLPPNCFSTLTTLFSCPAYPRFLVLW